MLKSCKGLWARVVGYCLLGLIEKGELSCRGLRGQGALGGDAQRQMESRACECNG